MAEGARAIAPVEYTGAGVPPEGISERSERKNKLTAQTTEAWLLTLRERVEEVEEDTSEALAKRRELVKLLVEQIKVDRTEDGHTQVHITYRFAS